MALIPIAMSATAVAIVLVPPGVCRRCTGRPTPSTRFGGRGGDSSGRRCWRTEHRCTRLAALAVSGQIAQGR